MRRFLPVVGAPADTRLPEQSTEFSAGYDFFAPCRIVVPPWGHSKLVPLNVKAIMPGCEVLLLTIRSSLAVKKAHIQVAQGVAVIDADYANNPNNDGNIGVMFFNNSNRWCIINKGEKCCQGIFVTYFKVDNSAPAGKRLGGYGSTGR